MGMYDSFTSIVMCPCGHGESDDNIQSKDFGCNLDHLKQGERTDKEIERFMLADSSMGRGKGRWKELQERKLKTNKPTLAVLDSITEDDVRELSVDEIKEKYGDKTKFDLSFDNDYWHAYHKLGLSKTVFDGIHGMDFNCYTTCKGCNKWLEMTGHIVDDVFTGVTVDRVGE